MQDYLDPLPLVAILRGLPPAEAPAIGDALFDAGLRVLEVPLNSPEPLSSIAALAARFGTRALVGAGTVLQPAQVAEVAASGGRLIVMPHADVAVIRAAKAAGLICVPGVATPTEAFAALAAGADALKLFPAELLTPPVLKALRAVLPPAVTLLPVGGITPSNLHPYVAAGASGFGLGSALYKPGDSAQQVAAQARVFVDAWRAAGR
jgi:2-dehydro-3-deoxyphosphogalactonate aldolase